MRITICRDSGEVFAAHEITNETAEHLRYRLQDVNPTSRDERFSEPDHAPGDVDAQDFLSDLDTAIQGTINGTFDAE